MEPILKVNGIFPVYLGVGAEFNPYSIPDNFAYFIDGEGWKLFKRNGITVSIHKIPLLKGMETHKEVINYTGAKIPLLLIQQVTSFFKEVYKKYKSEAVGYLFYKDPEWEFFVPEQNVSAASAKYGEAPQKPGWSCAGTIHSHGSMSAFHSGTDQADEEDFDGVHITIGKVDSFPEYSCSVVVQGLRGMIDPSALITGMDSEKVPEAWLTAVKQDAPLVGYRDFAGFNAYQAKSIEETPPLGLSENETQYYKDLGLSPEEAQYYGIAGYLEDIDADIPPLRKSERHSTRPNWERSRHR